jgi:hypothetical protein
MAKTAAERQSARRARMKEEGKPQRQLMLEDEEITMLQKLCVARRPGRQPYAANELVGLLIRANHAKLEKQIANLNKTTCKKCGESLPVAECVFSGDSECWVTNGHKALSIKF